MAEHLQSSMASAESKPRSLATVSVVVSFLNSARTIRQCLLAILLQDYARNLFEVVVVDGGSTDGSLEICRELKSEFANLNLIVHPGASEPEGQSIGAQSSDSDIIMFTNSDIYVPPSWIKKHLEWLQQGYDLVGGRVFWGGDKFAFTWNMPKPLSPRFIQEQGLGLGFSNCSTTRATFNEVGGLSKIKSQHDTEFAFRVVRAGGRMILDPEIEVYHDHPFGSFKASFNRSLGYAVNHVLVMRTVYGKIVSGSGSPAMLPISSLIREWTCIAGVKTYKEHAAKAFETGIRTSLPEFLFIRLFSTKLGQGIGVFLGATKRKVAFKSVIDLHKRAHANEVLAKNPREGLENRALRLIA